MELELRDFIGLAGVPFLIAIGEFAKAQGLETARVPLVVMGLAISLNEGLAWYLQTDLALGLLVGVLTGLAASGFYSVQKTLRRL